MVSWKHPLPALLGAELPRSAAGHYLDPDFQVADVLILPAMDEPDPSCSRHFLERAADA